MSEEQDGELPSGLRHLSPLGPVCVSQGDRGDQWVRRQEDEDWVFKADATGLSLLFSTLLETGSLTGSRAFWSVHLWHLPFAPPRAGVIDTCTTSGFFVVKTWVLQI